ncbi:MAG: VIT1/CCC1 transporter family protein, partial [Panacagrimonas sp.]
MTSGSWHRERHRSTRAGWLRAAVLGANDGIISVSSLVVGIAAAGQSASVLLTGFAGLVAGALSMAAGEYVSVCTQADSEKADIARERRELMEEPESEQAELASIYRERGLDAPLAAEVARQLTRHDALGAHAREELGITEALRARPLQAALASALAFSSGAMIPIVTAAVVPPGLA